MAVVGIPVVVGSSGGIPVVISGAAPGTPITIQVTSTTAFVVEDANSTVILAVDTQTPRITINAVLKIISAAGGIDFSGNNNGVIRSGTTAFVVQNSAANANNLYVSDAGALWIRLGIANYQGIATVGGGVPALYGLDKRAGITAADGAPITLYTIIAANGLFRITSDIFATAAVTGTATYTVRWTENGTTQTMVITATTLNTLATATQLIRPDNATAITVQLTGVFTGTFTLAALVEQLA
jgi:hypothetical protein